MLTYFKVPFLLIIIKYKKNLQYILYNKIPGLKKKFKNKIIKFIGICLNDTFFEQQKLIYIFLHKISIN